MSGLTDEEIKKEIQNIASIYPTAFNLYDEPLNRLVQRIHSLLAKDREAREVCKEHGKPLSLCSVCGQWLMTDTKKGLQADLAARLEERKKAHENNLPDESDAANSFVLGMIDGLGEAVYEVKK